jgi:hypothetical protein
MLKSCADHREYRWCSTARHRNWRRAVYSPCITELAERVITPAVSNASVGDTACVIAAS